MILRQSERTILHATDTYAELVREELDSENTFKLHDYVRKSLRKYIFLIQKPLAIFKSLQD